MVSNTSDAKAVFQRAKAVFKQCLRVLTVAQVLFRTLFGVQAVSETSSPPLHEAGATGADKRPSDAMRTSPLNTSVPGGADAASGGH